MYILFIAPDVVVQDIKGHAEFKAVVVVWNDFQRGYAVLVGMN